MSDPDPAEGTDQTAVNEQSDAPDVPADAPQGQRRRRRRATRGVPRADADPVIPSRSADDTDEGWGEPSGPGDDERFLREVPPHW
ncbi:hypothetical protein [Cellulomonas sp. KRMCY2]|uniref:hypothetical protein n=1 Tax=Cellulomonas sp. KRMCY2 TaxID=1304865 RepID=UPI00045E737D|nr:hypothetical protein [Cellulomonas sp. KRMCY2]